MPDSASALPPARPRSSALLWATRILLALMGVMLIYASIYFTFFASPEEGGVSEPVDWVLAGWALAMGAGFVAVGVRLGSPRTLRIAAGLLLAHIVFGLIKLVGYDETEALGLFVVDLILLALLALTLRGGNGAGEAKARGSAGPE